MCICIYIYIYEWIFLEIIEIENKNRKLCKLYWGMFERLIVDSCCAKKELIFSMNDNLLLISLFCLQLSSLPVLSDPRGDTRPTMLVVRVSRLLVDLPDMWTCWMWALCRRTCSQVCISAFTIAYWTSLIQQAWEQMPGALLVPELVK